MNIKFLIVFLICFLSFSLPISALPCPPPYCGDCKEWDPVQQECVWKEGADCEDTLDCGSLSACYDCIDCSCVYTCSPEQFCCENGCCDSECCGTDGCCGENQYCCGDPTWNKLCCDANEVCCWELIMPGLVIEYYCNPPCWDEITDSNSCAESNEENYECPGCTVGLTSPTCLDFTWRDYSGLVIKECHDGCSWHVTDEICYEVKKCGGILKEDFVCWDCGSEGLMCQYCGDTCIIGGIVGCFIEGVCSLVMDCFDCCTLDEVVEPVREETCSCP